MKRVLLKLSGEALAGEQKRGFDEGNCYRGCQTDQDDCG